MEGYRYLLTLDILACLISICYAASKPHEMPDVTKEWGSGEVSVNCFKKEDLSRMNITSTNVYVSKDGENFVRRFNGKDTYFGGSNGSVRLNDDGSLTLRADYSSIGTYVCIYSGPISYVKTQTKVNVLEPPLRVLGCNATTAPNQSHFCQVNVPNGTRTLNFTAIKEGLRWANGTIPVVLPSDVSILMETNDTPNPDNSTSKSWVYEVNVTDMTSTSTLSFVMDGPTKEEILVLLYKAKSFTSDSNLISGQIGGIALGVIAVAVLTYWSSSTCWLGQIGIVEKH